MRTKRMPEPMPSKPTVICAWCKTTISEGDQRISHGICKACVRQEEGEMKKRKHQKRQS